MRTGTIELIPPRHGIVRRYPASKQPAGTTPHAVNVIAQDTLERRVRVAPTPQFTGALGAAILASRT